MKIFKGTAPLAALVLASCTSATDEREPASESQLPLPVVAHALLEYGDEDVAGRSRIAIGNETVDLDGVDPRFLTNGRVVVLDRSTIERHEYTVFDVDSRKKFFSGQVQHSRVAAQGLLPFVGVGPSSVFVMTVDKTRTQRLREYNLRFEPVRTVDLPGRFAATSDDPDAPHGTIRYEIVATRNAVFISSADLSGTRFTADAVTRVDRNGRVSSILKNKHISDLTVSSDGVSLLAAIAVSEPKYEVTPATKDLVELDPKTGQIVKSYGLPPPCKNYRGTTNAYSCLGQLDKVDGVFAASLSTPDTPTWKFTRGGWVEVKEQRGLRVAWQSAEGRLEQRSGSDDGDGGTAVSWVLGSNDRRTVKGAGDLTSYGWTAPGSLIRPKKGPQ